MRPRHARKANSESLDEGERCSCPYQERGSHKAPRAAADQEGRLLAPLLARESNSRSRPAIISNTRAGASPAFQNVCHCSRGLKIRSPGLPTITESPGSARCCLQEQYPSTFAAARWRRASWPTTWNEFLPISMPITVGCLRHGVLLVFGSPCQLRLLTGQEHGQTIHKVDLSTVLLLALVATGVSVERPSSTRAVSSDTAHRRTRGGCELRRI